MKRIAETVVAAGVSALLAFAYVIAVGRILGPAAYADFSAALSVIYFFAVALTPVTPTLARVVAALAVRSDDMAITRLRRAVMRRATVAFLITGVFAVAISPLAARAFHFRSAATFAFAMLTAGVFALLSVDRGVLQGLMMFRDYNISTVVETGIRLAGVLIIFALMNPTAPRALVSYGAGVLLAEVIVARRLKPTTMEDTPAPIDWTPITSLAGPMLALMIAIAVFQNADMLVVKRWFTASDSGQYGAATALAKSFGVLFVPLYVLAGPLLTRAYESEQPIVAIALKLSGIFVVLSAVPMVIVTVWPDQLVRALYGVAYADAAHIIAPLGGVAIITYCALMLVQVLITASSFTFLRVYGAVAVLQTAALLAYHRSVKDIITVLYAGQTIVLLAVIALVMRFSSSRRAASR